MAFPAFFRAFCRHRALSEVFRESSCPPTDYCTRKRFTKFGPIADRWPIQAAGLKGQFLSILPKVTFASNLLKQNQMHAATVWPRISLWFSKIKVERNHQRGAANQPRLLLLRFALRPDGGPFKA